MVSALRTRVVAIAVVVSVALAVAAFFSLSRRPPTAESKPAASVDERTTPADVSFLHVNSVPAATVTLDGKPVGNTPLEKLQVASGSHKLLFVSIDDATARRTLSVYVAPGATKAVIVRLRD